MFNFGKKASRGIKVRDLVWLSQASAEKALVREAFTRAQGGSSPLILTFFDSTFQRFRVAGEVEGVQVLLVPPGPAEIRLPRVTAPVILFAERYPLAAEDQRALAAIESTFPEAAEAVFYSSLESPVLRAFGGEKVQGLLTTLGLNEGECIEHPLVSRALRRAQDDLAKKAGVEIRCASAEEWLSRNLPRTPA
jgi:hypothetical protein